MTTKTTYLGKLHCATVHMESGSEIISHAPKNYGGDGGHFASTDLLGAALAKNILTTIAMKGQSRGIDITGATCELKRTMYPEPRRVGSIFCVIRIPKNFNEDDRKFIEDIADNCSVALSLHPDITRNVLFEYGH